MSVDTAVFILLTGHPPLPSKVHYTFDEDKGEDIYSIHECYLKLGTNMAEALIVWYAFKGTDYTGAFAGKGIISHYKTLVRSNMDILDAFSRFGITDDLPSDTINQVEKYLCLLYTTNAHCET